MHKKIKKIAELKLKQTTNTNELEKYQIINKILEDEECFKKMKTETAYNLLYDLDFSKTEIPKIYNELIFNEY